MLHDSLVSGKNRSIKMRIIDSSAIPGYKAQQPASDWFPIHIIVTTFRLFGDISSLSGKEMLNDNIANVFASNLKTEPCKTRGIMTALGTVNAYMQVQKIRFRPIEIATNTNQIGDYHEDSNARTYRSRYNFNFNNHPGRF